MTALDVLVEEKLADRALILGEMLRSGIKALNHPLIEDVRGKGLLNAVVIDESKSVRGRSTWQLCLLMMNRGLLALPTQGNMSVVIFVSTASVDLRHSIRLCPPLVIGEEDLRKAIKIFGKCLLDLDEVSVLFVLVTPPFRRSASWMIYLVTGDP
jgi:ornithine--oxo-acid transaminase